MGLVRVVGDERLWISGSVLQESDHWVARVLPGAAENLETVTASFAVLGCNAHLSPHHIVAVDVPADVDCAAVLRVLEEGQRQHRWGFEFGVKPPFMQKGGATE